MRITSQMTQASNLYYLQRNYNAVSDLNTRISATQRVLNLSDDPASAVAGIKLTTTITKIEQYIRNIDSASGSLSLVDGYLASVKSSLDKVSSTLIGGATNGTTDEQRSAYASEMQTLLQQIVSAANARDGERYVFGGTNTATEPFTVVNGYVAYNGNDDSILIQTGQNSTTAVNCTGTDAFGNLLTSISSAGDLNPAVNLCTDVSTKLSDLNGGSGVPSGKVVVYYSSYPDGLEVDISGCDTLEDVKDRIEQATLEASRALDPSSCPWLDGDTLDWRDLQDRYVQVTVNPDNNGISLREIDLGEALPEPTAREQRQGLDYSGAPGYDAGGGGTGVGAGAVYDKPDYVYGDGSGYYAALRVEDRAGGKTAAALGIEGATNAYDPTSPDAALDGFIHGTDLNPKISGATLLADLAGYNDAVYTITNGGIPGGVTIIESSSDSGNVFGNWDLNNLSLDYNTGTNGELYARVTRRESPYNDIYVEIYAVPLDKAKASDLVASGNYDGAQDGGTVKLTEANGSGVSGSVGILLPTTASEATVNLRAEFSSDLQAVINVPAFVEETDSRGNSLDSLNILSGWSITGLDKPPAEDYDINHPASTDLDGNVTVSTRIVEDNGVYSLVVELYRPAYGDQPAALIASGTLELDGEPPLATASSGRISLEGVDGFEGISGSVYVELPAGEDLASGLDFNLTATFATVEDLARAVEEAGVYVSVGISDDGKSLEFVSRLAGAYLTVSEDTDCYEQMGDVFNQLSALDLNGLVRGVNSDANGNLYFETVYYPPDPSRTDGKTVLLSDSGEQVLVDAGYYVRAYSSADALDSSYENRDNSSLVAEGFIAADEYAGAASTLSLQEKNGSGVSGTVDFDYYGGRAATGGGYDNPNITVTPGGIRSSGSVHATVQEIDVSGFVPGVHFDYSGAAHATIARDGGTTTVTVYKDASHTHATCKGEINAATGTVVLYETDKKGNYALDANGDRIRVGELTVAANTLADGQTDAFAFAAGSLGASGQEREENVFSTIADAIAALNANDVEALHYLIDEVAADIDHLMEAAGSVGARVDQLELLAERYESNLVTYESMRTSAIGMDADVFAEMTVQLLAAETAYNASLQLAARYLQMSLLNYL